MVRDHLKQAPIAPLYISDNVQMVACKIGSPAVLAVVGVYRSPRVTVMEDEQLVTKLRDLTRTPLRLCILGDFNAPGIQWATESCEVSGFENRLLDLVHDCRLHQHIEGPTRFREGQNPSILDLLFTRGPTEAFNLTRDCPLGKSDHVVIRFNLTLKVPAPRARVVRLYRKINRDDIQKDAREIPWVPDGPRDVEVVWTGTVGNVVSLTNKHAPEVELKGSRLKPWFTARVRRAISKRNSLWHKTQLDDTFANRRHYTRFKNSAAKSCKTARSEYELRLARCIKTHSKKFWRYVQSQARSRKAIGTLMRLGITTLENDQDIANAFKDHFQTIFRESTNPNVDGSVTHPTPNDTRWQIETQKVQSVLESLNPDKSAGPDGIHPAVLQIIAPTIAEPLTRLFNLSLDLGTVPADWRRAIIAPIHKNGDMSDIENYRPVSLTSVVCKAMERIIREKLGDFLIGRQFFSKAQHGFLKGRSCLTNLLVFLDEVTERVDQGEEVVVCYLDFQKAFDSVNHRLLLVKLRQTGAPEQICNWVSSFLHNRTYQVRIRTTLSPEGRATSGVPQGSILGPLLFLVFINDLAEELENPCLMYADDVKIIGSSNKGPPVQADLDKLSAWMIKSDMPLNIAKCCVLSKLAPEPPLHIKQPGRENHNLEVVNSIKDLGITVTSDFTPSEQCAKAAHKARKALFGLRAALCSRDKEVLIPLYRSVVRTHMEYCVQAWAPYRKKDIDRIEKVQRLATRMVKGTKGMSYEDRLRQLKLFSMRRRRLRGDLIEAFRQIKMGHLRLLQPTRARALRGHEYHLEIRRSRLDVRKFFFTNRVRKYWNRLPKRLVKLNSIQEFKKALDRVWETIFPEVSV